MTGFRGQADGGAFIIDLTPERLRILLDACEDFMLFDNPSWGQQFYAQALRFDNGAWRVELSLGGPDRHIWTDAPNTDAVFDILRSWAATDGWWEQAFRWEPMSSA